MREGPPVSGPSTASPSPAAAPVETIQPRAEGPTTAPGEAWAVDLGAVIYARPTLAPDAAGRTVAYVGSHSGRFVGVVVDGPDAGTVVLELVVDGIIWSTAVIDDQGQLYFGADDDHLYAVDTARGEVTWRRRLGQCAPARAPGPEGMRCDVDGGPTLSAQGDLYVGADGLYRVSRDGEVLWHHPAQDQGPGAHVATTPLVSEHGVVFGNYARQVVALDHDGQERWSVTLGADVDGSPAMGIDGTIYVGSDDGALHAIGPDGVETWQVEVGREVRARPVVAPDGTIIFGAYDGGLRAVEIDGTPRWTLPTDGPIHASATLDPAGRIFVGSRDERLYALDLDGHVFWSLELPGQLDGAVSISPVGTLVVGCDDGVLRGLR